MASVESETTGLPRERREHYVSDMSKVLQDAFRAADRLDEASQEKLARSIMRQIEELERRRPTDRQAQIERIRRLSPLHGRSDEFLEIARELHENIRFKHDDEDAQ